MKKENSSKLVSKQFLITETMAESLIMAGKIFLEKNHSYKVSAGEMFPLETIFYQKSINIEISRGEIKLVSALDKFKIIVDQKICLDIGASTGGFTNTLILRNASKIYAVDSGKNQLDYKLRINPKVISMEKCNFRHINFLTINSAVDIITVDVSHISLKKILEKIPLFLKPSTEVILLIKPQFEAKYHEVINGLVKNKLIHFRVIQEIVNFAKKFSLFMQNFTYSPILGKTKGNIEYFVHLKSININIEETIIKTTIDEAWKQLYSE